LRIFQITSQYYFPIYRRGLFHSLIKLTERWVAFTGNFFST
jgi:hypothetical protein